MCSEPICMVLILGIPAAIVALTVGMGGWPIARDQAAVAAGKLKLDLFEKRYPIFLQTWQIMSEVGKRLRNCVFPL